MFSGAGHECISNASSSVRASILTLGYRVSILALIFQGKYTCPDIFQGKYTYPGFWPSKNKRYPKLLCPLYAQVIHEGEGVKCFAWICESNVFI